MLNYVLGERTIVEVITPTEAPTPTQEPSPTLTPTLTPKPTLRPIVPTKAPTPTPIVIIIENTPIPTKITYRILSLSELANLNGANSEVLAAAYEAYNTFLQTPNLQDMDFNQQREIFNPIATAAIQKLVDKQKAEIEGKINALGQQTQYYNQINERYEECLNQKIATINSNPYLSESSRLSQIERAKQECAYE